MDPNQSNQPLSERQKQAAINAIRRKLDSLYGEEPSAEKEIREIQTLGYKKLSKHQKFMQQLANSERSLGEIQAAWHEYYMGLSDRDKHQVWREFYEKHEQAKKQFREKRTAITGHLPVKPEPVRSHALPKPRDAHQAKAAVINKAKLRAKLKGRHNLQSMLVGLSIGLVLSLVLLFSFFNERFITPFIRPSYGITTPIIVDPNASSKASSKPNLIIPKINLEVPVVYNEPSIEEKAIQRALENGVVHYATTPNPGEKGNGVIFGHSSSNILNSGRYKYAFILLKSLEKGDTFIIDKDSKRYVYKVYKKTVVKPENVSVLNATEKPATMTLITCDPPGLSTNRLVIVGEQIFPNPAKNKSSSVNQDRSEKPRVLPSDAPSLWQRIIEAL